FDTLHIIAGYSSSFTQFTFLFLWFVCEKVTCIRMRASKFCFSSSFETFCWKSVCLHFWHDFFFLLQTLQQLFITDRAKHHEHLKTFHFRFGFHYRNLFEFVCQSI